MLHGCIHVQCWRFFLFPFFSSLSGPCFWGQFSCVQARGGGGGMVEGRHGIGAGLAGTPAPQVAYDLVATLPDELLVRVLDFLRCRVCSDVNPICCLCSVRRAGRPARWCHVCSCSAIMHDSSTVVICLEVNPCVWGGASLPNRVRWG